MRYIQCVVLAFSWVVGFAPVAAETIKKTSSGLCHPPESPYYDRTQNFRAFDSTESCLARGGRLPYGLVKESQNWSHQRTSESYKRAAFGHGWDDADGDCQDSRAEALISTSTSPVRFADGDRCRVITGRWISPFTGDVIQNAREIDIDHVVPLNWAWKRGAYEWSDDRRETFANDPINLWPVELGLNRSISGIEKIS